MRSLHYEKTAVHSVTLKKLESSIHLLFPLSPVLGEYIRMKAGYTMNRLLAGVVMKANMFNGKWDVCMIYLGKEPHTHSCNTCARTY